MHRRKSWRKKIQKKILNKFDEKSIKKEVGKGNRGEGKKRNLQKSTKFEKIDRFVAKSHTNVQTPRKTTQ